MQHLVHHRRRAAIGPAVPVTRQPSHIACTPAFLPPAPVFVSSAVNAAEDPEKILDQAVTDMQSDLIRLRQAAAEVRQQPSVDVST